MAPVIKTYGKKKTRKKIDKEDTFDKLFKTSIKSSNVFESSTDREKSETSPNAEEKSEYCKDEGESPAFSVLQSLGKSSRAELEETEFRTANSLDVSDLTPYKVAVKRIFQKNAKSSKVHKTRQTSKKKKIPPQGKNDFTNENLFSLASSTPKIILTQQKSIISNIDRNVSPIETHTDSMQSSSRVSDSPKGFKVDGFLPKNILNTDNSLCSNCINDSSLLLGFEDIPKKLSETFYGFPTISDKSQFEKLISIDELKGATTIPKIETFKERKESIPRIPKESLENESNQSPEDIPHGSTSNFSSRKQDIYYSHEELLLSKSMQNLNISSEKEHNVIIKSSSYEEIKPNRTEYKNSPICKINIQSAAADLNPDSSDIEESAVNSADERSCSIRSGQLDEEESAFHSSDDENVSGYSKDKDSTDFTNQKCSSKGDSESAIFSATHKDTSCTNPSEDVSADDCELYTESEIAKSSDSIEVGRTANNENVSSDLSTSSDKEVLKEDERSMIPPQNLNNLEKSDNSKAGINYPCSRTFSTKSKDSSFYSMENSASDESELSFESDSELSCESSRSSRKSSLESGKTLSKEALEHLRESISLIKVQDEYEDALCSKSRKSLTKRGTEWECPPSPRRCLFPLAPLFPLPENQEDPGDDLGQGQGSGSMCDSTASEEDSHHSGTRKSRGKLKESLFRKREESGVEGRSSGEDESTKNSPVRETTRMRRSRRISRKSRESESRLNMVIEESDSESTEADIVPQMEHIVLPTGKRYRRSLSIIKHLAEDSFQLPPNKGRHYDQSIESIIKLQSKTGFESPCDGRRSLLIKRKSLLSQCYTPSASPASLSSRDLFSSIIGSPLTSRKSLRKLSCLIKPGNVDSPVAPKVTSLLIEEEENEEEEEKEVEGSPYQEKLGAENELNNTTLRAESGENEDGDELRSVILNHEDLVFRVCQQTKPYPFSEILYGDWFELSSKIGEGVYGEVFMVPRDNCKNVLKIIPIEGSLIVNEEKQKTYDEISNELVIAATLSDLREENEEFMTSGFAELIHSSIVKGRYPKKLIQLWNEYDEQKGSDNDSPSIFGSNQLYLVLELGNAGTDLENYSFSTAKQGLSVFKQTVCALAVAEAYAEFEHRDLHWGNVLVSRTSERDIPFILNKEKYTILTNGVKATIIDFTLSRMTFTCSPFYYDLSQDPDMFIGTGDYQFDIYRHMKEDVQNKWNSFVPKTNVRWLHYLVDKMITKVRYQRKTAKVHTDSMKILKEIESWILSCDCAVQVALRVVNYK